MVYVISVQMLSFRVQRTTKKFLDPKNVKKNKPTNCHHFSLFMLFKKQCQTWFFFLIVLHYLMRDRTTSWAIMGTHTTDKEFEGWFPRAWRVVQLLSIVWGIVTSPLSPKGWSITPWDRMLDGLTTPPQRLK